MKKIKGIPEPMMKEFTQKLKNYEKAGLAYCGKDFEGQEQFIGTKKQWKKGDEFQEQIIQDYMDAREDEGFRNGEPFR